MYAFHVEEEYRIENDGTFCIFIFDDFSFAFFKTREMSLKSFIFAELFFFDIANAL